MDFAPGQGLGLNHFHEHKYSVHFPIPRKFSLIYNAILPIFSIQLYNQPKSPCCKIDQGHPCVMIYIT